MRILIAEDDPVSRRVLEASLRKWGYDVIVTCDGIEAWQVLQSKDAPMLTILDWMMPGMDGITVCQKVREMPRSQPTYIILLTVKGQKDSIVEGLQAGADDYAIKPFDPEELRARVRIGERIVELYRVKDEILSIVSHELRSPLTSILGSLGLIADGDTGEISQQTKKMVDIAYRNSERLLHMINEMLDIRKIESGKMAFHRQPLELKSLAEQAIEVNQGYAQQLEVKLVLKDAFPGVKVNADGDRLIQVFTNLLSNAIRFSPPDGTVEISISNHDNIVRAAVIDHGTGIPEEFRDQVFRKFAQARQSGARRKGNTGLGLSIARAIIEEMGGRIGFETKTAVGTTFYFDLPQYHDQPA